MALKLYKSSNWWYADFSLNGQRLKPMNLQVEVRGRRPESLREMGDSAFEESRAVAKAEHDRLKRTLQDDRQRLRMIDTLQAESESRSMKIKDVVGYCQKELRARGRNEVYIKDVSRVLQDFAGQFSQNREVHQITRAEVVRWVNGLKGSSRTINKKRGFIQWMFRRLMEEGYVDRSPAEGIRAVQGFTKHRQPLSEVEVKAVLENAGEFKPVVLCALHTGMRLGDCARLNMSSVDLQEGWVTVVTSKTGARVEVPLHPDLRAVLPKKKAGAAFPRWGKQKVSSLTHEYIRVRRKAKVEKDFHSLRVTWVTRAISAGVPVDVVRKVTGHQTVEVVLKHYLHPDREGIKTAFQKAGILPGEVGLLPTLIERLKELDSEQLEKVAVYLDEV